MYEKWTQRWILPCTVSGIVNFDRFPGAGLRPEFQARIRRAFGHTTPAGWCSGELDQCTSCAKQAWFTRLGEMSESYDDLRKMDTFCNLKTRTLQNNPLPLSPPQIHVLRVSGEYAHWLNSHTPVSYLGSFQVLLDWSRAWGFGWILICGAWTPRLRAKSKNASIHYTYRSMSLNLSIWDKKTTNNEMFW